jgi:peptidyl-prolyl cis-trans isomerase C
MLAGSCRAVLAAGLLAAAPGAALRSAGEVAALPAAEGPTPQVVATVNGRPISSGQLAAAVEADRKRRYLASDLSASERRFLKRRALRRLIGRELLFQAAKRERMKVSRRVLDEQLASARPEFASEELYQLYLERAGMTEEEMIRQLEYRLLSDAYAKGITDRVKIDEADARKAHEADRERFAAEEQVHCAQIVLLVSADAPIDEREAARTELESIRQRVLAGESFADLAREHSQSPFAANGGDMGFVSRGRMRPEFDAAVFATPVGEVTPVFATAYGFNLVQVLDRRAAALPTFAEVKASLMMHLTRQRKRDLLQDHIGELWDRAKVEILVPELEGLTAAGR